MRDLHPRVRTRGHEPLPGLCGADLLALLLARRALPRSLQTPGEGAGPGNRGRESAAAPRPRGPAQPRYRAVFRYLSAVRGRDQPCSAVDRFRGRQHRLSGQGRGRSHAVGRLRDPVHRVGDPGLVLCPGGREPPRRRGGDRPADRSAAAGDRGASANGCGAATGQGRGRGRQSRQKPLCRGPLA